MPMAARRRWCWNFARLSKCWVRFNSRIPQGFEGPAGRKRGWALPGFRNPHVHHDKPCPGHRRPHPRTARKIDGYEIHIGQNRGARLHHPVLRASPVPRRGRVRGRTARSRTICMGCYGRVPAARWVATRCLGCRSHLPNHQTVEQRSMRWADHMKHIWTFCAAGEWPRRLHKCTPDLWSRSGARLLNCGSLDTAGQITQGPRPMD